jgi:hypothetical protein
MNDDTITLDSIPFAWIGTSASTGFTAQEVSTVSLASTVAFTATNNTVITGSYTMSTPYEGLEIRLAKVEKIIAEEEEIRRSHPAVKMAYDEYRLLMILSKGKSPDPLPE